MRLAACAAHHFLSTSFVTSSFDYSLLYGVHHAITLASPRRGVALLGTAAEQAKGRGRPVITSLNLLC